MSIETEICNYLLEKDDRTPQNELMGVVSCSEATLSRRVRKLEELGYITREKEREGRSSVNYLTLIKKDFNFQLSTSKVKRESSRNLKDESSSKGNQLSTFSIQADNVKSESSNSESSKVFGEKSKVILDTFDIEGKILDLYSKIDELKKNSIHNQDFTPKEYFSIIDDELSEVGTDISTFKDEIDFLKNDIQDLVLKFEKSKKLPYPEFKQFILDNRARGSHYSSYIKQLKYKESDFKNFYLIYLDLP